MENIKILILLLIFSCNPQESNGHKEDSMLKIEYNFYASSGGEPIYRVLYCDEEVVVENLEHSHTYKGKITKDKIEEIESIISKLKPNNDIETDIILDSWRIELIINGITYYNKTEVTKETLPKDIRQLLYILIKNSTVDINLYDFS
jgi:hypothetical protein